MTDDACFSGDFENTRSRTRPEFKESINARVLRGLTLNRGAPAPLETRALPILESEYNERKAQRGDRQTHGKRTRNSETLPLEITPETIHLRGVQNLSPLPKNRPFTFFYQREKRLISQKENHS